MIIDLSKLSEQEAKVLNKALVDILDGIKNHISNDDWLRNHRTVMEKLDDYDLWNPNGIIEEYSFIKNKESKLPSTLRKTICTIFEQALVYLKMYKQHEVQ